MVARILVALDNSASRTCVFEEALALARQEGARLMLLHVLSTDERDPSPLNTLIPYDCSISREELVEQYQQQQQQAEQQALEALQELADRARLIGVPVEVKQLIGNPRELICYTARTWNADLIVMGRHKRSWISQWLMGSVSHVVEHHAPCSIRIVPQPPVNSTEKTLERSNA
ncbi:MAG: universal stress protein [Elainellaceae cyanobacterium]